MTEGRNRDTAPSTKSRTRNGSIKKKNVYQTLKLNELTLKAITMIPGTTLPSTSHDSKQVFEKQNVLPEDSPAVGFVRHVSLSI